MIPFAKAQHHIRRFLASVIDCSFSERAKAFDNDEAGDFLIATERARQVLVEREEQEEVAEPKPLSCPYHGEWCAGETCWWIKSQDSAPAGADPTSATPPAAEVEGPSEDSDIPPSPAEGHPTSPIDVAAEAAIEMFDFFVERYALPELRAHFADNDDNAAENVRRRIRSVALVAVTANARLEADARLFRQVTDLGFQPGRDFDPPFTK